jgi:glutaminyl-peptide cyclotransferase
VVEFDLLDDSMRAERLRALTIAMGLRSKHGPKMLLTPVRRVDVVPKKQRGKQRFCCVLRETLKPPSICQRLFRCGLCSALVVLIAVCALGMLEFWLMQKTQGLLLLPDSTSRVRSEESSPLRPNDFTRTGSFELIETVPHDTRAFTQGLLVVSYASTDDDGDNNKNTTLAMYEGTGVHGASQLRRLDIHTGRVLERHALPRLYFGEGIAHYRDKNGQLRLIQLTWRQRTAFEYALHHHSGERRRFADPVANWTFQTTTKEGWGITNDANNGLFYVTDGSKYMHIWDAETKTEVRKVVVWYQRPGMAEPTTIHSLNELEWDPASNTVLANVWKEDVILRIDPTTGFVRTIYDLKNLFPRSQRSWGTDVLNGIALTYDASLHQQVIPAEAASAANAGVSSGAETDQAWVTGKYWPHMYRIRLIDEPLS